MARLSLSNAWDDSKRIFARDGGLLTSVALALFVLPEVVAVVVSPPTITTPTIEGRIIGLVAALIGVIGQLAIVRLALGPSTTVGSAIGHGFRRFPSMLGALVLLGLGLLIILVPIMAVLMAAGIVELPGGRPSPSFGVAVLVLAVACVFLAVKFIMTVPVASAEDAGPWTVIKRSWTLTNGNYWPLFGLEVLLLVAAVVLLLAAQMVGAVIANVVGGDVTPFSVSALILAIFVAAAQAAFTVLASLMLARIYAQLSGRAETQPSVPTTGI
jgi:hypothetical protein